MTSKSKVIISDFSKCESEPLNLTFSIFSHNIKNASSRAALLSIAQYLKTLLHKLLLFLRLHALLLNLGQEFVQVELSQRICRYRTLLINFHLVFFFLLLTTLVSRFRRVLADKADFEVSSILVPYKCLLHESVSHPEFATFGMHNDRLLKHALELDSSDLAQSHHIVDLNAVVLKGGNILSLELF